VLIQEKNPQDEYARAVVFDHYRDDLPSNTSANEYTPAIEDIYWEPSPATRSTEFQAAYEKLHELKEQTAEDEKEAAEEESAELSDVQREELARTLVEDDGWTQEAAANHKMVDRSQQWVSKKLR